MKTRDILLLIGLVLFTAFSCGPRQFEKKKIVYVNSYHQGFPPSDQITAGVLETLPSDSFEVVAHFMDTKRNPSQEYIKNRAAELADSIKREKPDLLIVSDDNALKHLVIPHFQNSPLPIVFCGVNWSVEQYDLSGLNITGVIEMLPVEESIHTLRYYYPDMKSLLVLNENTTTSRKTRPILDTLLTTAGLVVTQKLVDDFDAWKSAFIEGNKTFDVIYLQTRGAIKNWDHEQALKIINEHLRVPTFTCEDFMMPYAVFGLTQISKEQGLLAAKKAKKILHGINPGEIPLSKNQMTTIWINKRLAAKINFSPVEEHLSKARLVE